MCSNYENIVKTELSCLLSIIGSEIIPRCYEFLRLVEPISRSEKINKRSQQFVELFDKLLEMEENLQARQEKSSTLVELSELRNEINETSDVVNKILNHLPKKETWPEYEDFINLY